MKRLEKFYVRFSDKHETFTQEIKLNCSKNEFDDFLLEHTGMIEELEKKHGKLSVEIDGSAVGLVSSSFRSKYSEHELDVWSLLAKAMVEKELIDVAYYVDAWIVDNDTCIVSSCKEYWFDTKQEAVDYEKRFCQNLKSVPSCKKKGSKYRITTKIWWRTVEEKPAVEEVFSRSKISNSKFSEYADINFKLSCVDDNNKHTDTDDKRTNVNKAEFKFVVNFEYGGVDYADELEELEDDPDFDDGAWFEEHTYRNETMLYCSEEEFDEFLHSEEVDKIEREYGILDVSGCSGEIDEIGFDSYEIDLENAPIVWDLLVAELTKRNLVKK